MDGFRHNEAAAGVRVQRISVVDFMIQQRVFAAQTAAAAFGW